MDGPGVDLASMLCLHLPPDLRNQYQDSFLEHYLNILNHTRENIDDAQLRSNLCNGHIQNFVVPIYQQYMGCVVDDYMDYMNRLFSAFDDLHCEEFV